MTEKLSIPGAHSPSSQAFQAYGGFVLRCAFAIITEFPGNGSIRSPARISPHLPSARALRNVAGFPREPVKRVEAEFLKISINTRGFSINK